MQHPNIGGWIPFQRCFGKECFTIFPPNDLCSKYVWNMLHGQLLQKANLSSQNMPSLPNTNLASSSSNFSKCLTAILSKHNQHSTNTRTSHLQLVHRVSKSFEGACHVWNPFKPTYLPFSGHAYYEKLNLDIFGPMVGLLLRCEIQEAASFGNQAWLQLLCRLVSTSQ